MNYTVQNSIVQAKKHDFFWLPDKQRRQKANAKSLAAGIAS